MPKFSITFLIKSLFLLLFRYLAYYEICKQVSNVVYDQNYKVPHGTVSGQTAFYDNKQSITDKVNFKFVF